MFRKAAVPTVSEHAKLKAKQLSEFLKINPAAQCVSNGLGVADTTVTYTLPIQTASSGSFVLHILLGPLFPERPPVCQLLSASSSSTRLHHRYLDGNGYLSLHPKLQPAHWSPHQNLGLLIQDIVRDFIQQPPQMVAPTQPPFSAANLSPFAEQKLMQQQSQYGYNAAPSSNGSSSVPPTIPPRPSFHASPAPAAGSHSASPAVVNSISPAPHSVSPASVASAAPAPVRTRPPEVPSSFPLLDTFTIAQLEALENDSEALKDFAYDLPAIQQLEHNQQQLLVRVESLSKDNLSHQNELESLAIKTNFQATQLREHQQQFQQLLARQQQVMQRYSLSTILNLLETNIASIEEKSEETKGRYETLNQVAGSVVGSPAGGAEDQGLLEQFIKERMLVHERSAKKERLVEMYGRQ